MDGGRGDEVTLSLRSFTERTPMRAHQWLQARPRYHQIWKSQPRLSLSQLPNFTTVITLMF